MVTRLAALARGALALLAVAALSCGVAAAQPDVATVTLDNQSNQGLSLFVDHTARCYAPAHGSCFTDIDPGDHTLGAIDADGNVVRERPMTAEAGGRYVWRVWRE